MARDIVINDVGYVGRERRPFVESTTNGQAVRWLADSGAAVTVLDETLCNNSAQRALKQAGMEVQIPHNFRISAASGDRLTVLGLFWMNIRVEGHNFRHKVFVVRHLKAGAIMGMDLLSEHDALIH